MKNFASTATSPSQKSLFALATLFALVLFTGPTASAQDLLFYKNGEDLSAKILEISSTEVKLKKWDNLDGPTITIPKSEVWMIKYQNGTKELFQKQATAQKSETNAEPLRNPHQKISYTPVKTQPASFFDEGYMEKKPIDRNSFHVFAGASMPTGQFKDPVMGGAKTGFVIGLEEVTRFGNGMLRPTFALAYAKHGIASELEIEYDGAYYYATVSGNYGTLTGLTGLRLETATPKAKVYAAAAGGYSLTSCHMNVRFDGFDESVDQNVNGNHFSFNVGAGVIIGKVDIGLRMNKTTANLTGDFDAQQDMNTATLTLGYHF